MRVVISGGGSGGHIFPAIAIGHGIKERWSEAEILFVGAKGKMEMSKVPEAGFKIKGIWISGIARKRSLKNLLVPLKIISSLVQCYFILKKHQPNVVIGVGGFASGPLLKMAQWLNIPTLIQEQNSYPGLTNKLLAKNADKICVAFDHMDRFFEKEKIVLTGNPTRSIFRELSGNLVDAYDHFDLDPQLNTILIFGGSLGAKSINEAVRKSFSRLKETRHYQVLWQMGAIYADEFGESEVARLAHVKAVKFIKRMDMAYRIADVVICRAGALTLAELAMTGSAAILVPSPNVAEDHQTKNALALVEKEAAVILADKDVDQLFEKAESVMTDPELKNKLKSNIALMSKPNAVELILDQIGTLK